MIVSKSCGLARFNSRVEGTNWHELLIRELLSNSAVEEIVNVMGRKGLGMREHTERVAATAHAIAAAIKIGDSEFGMLHLGFLHEVEKLGVPDAILFKPGGGWLMRTYPWHIRRPQRHFAPGYSNLSISKPGVPLQAHADCRTSAP